MWLTSNYRFLSFQVHCSAAVSNFVTEPSLENAEELLDEGFCHFMQSMNQLEKLALHRPYLKHAFGTNNRPETDTSANKPNLHFLQ